MSNQQGLLRSDSASALGAEVHWRSSAEKSNARRSGKILGRTLGRALSAFTWLLCIAAGAAVYMNVLSDDSDVRARADALARQHAGCGEKCVVKHMQGQRSVLEYRADYAIDGIGDVRITCRRAAIVVGEHACRPEQIN